MPYLLLTPSTLFWRRNDVLRHLVVQGTNPVLMTGGKWALNAVMLYKRQIGNVQWPLHHHNGSKLLVLTLHVQLHSVGLQPKSAPGKAFYIAALSLIVPIINRLISHVRLSPRYGREMLSRTAGQWLRHSHGNQSHVSLLNRFSFPVMSMMSRAEYCSLLRNILLPGSQLCPLRSWLFILTGIGTCSLVKNQQPVDK
ncbi:TPA: hypothetical protein MAQ09_004011 [Klebsiella pneumoniae]|uniref:hypothetical protein n=1 Tax=Klebsiella variicola TaxID=244366 RepID=UPI0023635C21|nr:hypothetical protein [Klebsiella variicola]MDD1951956.1 hypothetical protein [Klebsiella variicola]HBS7231262.1 hypothetical protein [Klebsiella pneumoniae]